VIAIAGSQKRKACSRRRNDKFLRMLPEIRKQAQFAFRGLPIEAREEMVQEVLATAYHMFRRLAARGKLNLAYATPLAQYAIKHTRAGRRIGSRRNRRDVTSPCSLAMNGVVLERLSRFNPRTGQWREILVEDRTADPAKIAAARIDFASWLRTLSTRDRRVAETLALGESTSRVADMFKISAPRVSQLRRDFYESWRKFVGELADARGPSVATA
jgi:hypothetical protein